MNKYKRLTKHKSIDNSDKADSSDKTEVYSDCDYKSLVKQLAVFEDILEEESTAIE